MHVQSVAQKRRQGKQKHASEDNKGNSARSIQVFGQGSQGLGRFLLNAILATC